MIPLRENLFEFKLGFYNCYPLPEKRSSIQHGLLGGPLFKAPAQKELGYLGRRRISSAAAEKENERMEQGSHQNPSASTFSIAEEDHTMANSLRFVINKECVSSVPSSPRPYTKCLRLWDSCMCACARARVPRVTFCGYNIPHPSEAIVNIRVQTTGDHASEVLKDSCHKLISLCEHVRNTFDDAVEEFKQQKKAQQKKASSAPMDTSE
ncbi:hypothetical protein Drorol1_Dr00004267 [Drosera rotundifolia]